MQIANAGGQPFAKKKCIRSKAGDLLCRRACDVRRIPEVDLGVVVAALIYSIMESLPLAAARVRRQGAEMGAILKAEVAIFFNGYVESLLLETQTRSSMCWQTNGWRERQTDCEERETQDMACKVAESWKLERQMTLVQSEHDIADGNGER